MHCVFKMLKEKKKKQLRREENKALQCLHLMFCWAFSAALLAREEERLHDLQGERNRHCRTGLPETYRAYKQQVTLPWAKAADEARQRSFSMHSVAPREWRLSDSPLLIFFSLNGILEAVCKQDAQAVCTAVLQLPRPMAVQGSKARGTSGHTVSSPLQTACETLRLLMLCSPFALGKGEAPRCCYNIERETW